MLLVVACAGLATATVWQIHADPEMCALMWFCVPPLLRRCRRSWESAMPRPNLWLFRVG